VLKLAIAALEDPHCNTTTLCVAQHVYEEFRTGEPLSLERYEAAVQQFDTITTAALTREKLLRTRAHLLFRLRVQLLMVYPAPVVGKCVAVMLCTGARTSNVVYVVYRCLRHDGTQHCFTTAHHLRVKRT
jgi:hypothetical protein